MARQKESGHPAGRSGGAAGFLNEEPRRGRLTNGSEVMPRPHFVQIDNGAHNASPGGDSKIGIGYNPTKARMKSSNLEKDISGGLF